MEPFFLIEATMEIGELIRNRLGDENPGDIRVLCIEKEALRFQYVNENGLTNEIVLKAGYASISSRFYKHEIPTESEIEYAINFIEDELMSTRELLNRDEKLVCFDNILVELLQKNKAMKEQYTTGDIEAIFSRYANLSMGEPLSRNGLQPTTDDFAVILVLREVMHHLKFKQIRIYACE
jgi:hypothetical protein